METYEHYEKKMTKNAERYHKHLGIDDNSLSTKTNGCSISSKGVLAFIFLVLLIFCIYKFAFTGNIVSFEGFLNWLGSVKSTTIKVNLSDFTIKGEWVILDGIRQFINALGSVVGVGVFLGANLINLFIFVGQFIAFLFA